MAAQPVINDIVPVFDAQTGVLTLTITKTDIISNPSGACSPSTPVVEVVTLDLSHLVL